ncbi:SH3 domain-containing protein 2-like [Asparagus officinalis]|uniref:SH3 domain-containing protein 2-like n=1 Tax=Asparagus officinalis TaxID=4686 RepID=UPI00098DEC3D|nr:SH3 domain-containing protein 2-like [Asparagus officinalis]
MVRGVEGYIAIGSKQVEIELYSAGHKLSEDSMKFGVDETCTSSNALSKAALSYAKGRALIQNEHGILLKALGSQVSEPLKSMIVGARLEDARLLAKRYDKMRQEMEAQTIEVSKRQQKLREVPGNTENNLKLEAAESKLQELKSNMSALGKEAVAAMTEVEAQQQRLTLQLLLEMIEAERTYHQRMAAILEQLEGEMTSEFLRNEVSPRPVMKNCMPSPPSYEEDSGMYVSQNDGPAESMEYFLAEVMLSFQAETDAEINLSAGDYVVVRKVSSNGWAEGECKGKAGWFPYRNIQRRERVLASKITEVYWNILP